MSEKSLITADDLLLMGDIGPCELVKGELIYMSPTSGRHGGIASRIHRRIALFVEMHNLGETYIAETGFLVARAPDTVRAPDVSFVPKEKIPPEGEPDDYWEFAPELAVEVVSKNDRWSEVEEKVEEWLHAGTRLVWVVDPKTRTVHVYHATYEARILHEGDTLEGEDVLPEFMLPLVEIFV